MYNDTWAINDQEYSIVKVSIHNKSLVKLIVEA